MQTEFFMWNFNCKINNNQKLFYIQNKYNLWWQRSSKHLRSINICTYCYKTCIIYSQFSVLFTEELLNYLWVLSAASPQPVLQVSLLHLTYKPNILKVWLAPRMKCKKIAFKDSMIFYQLVYDYKLNNLGISNLGKPVKFWSEYWARVKNDKKKKKVLGQNWVHPCTP